MLKCQMGYHLVMSFVLQKHLNYAMVLHLEVKSSVLVPVLY